MTDSPRMTPTLQLVSQRCTSRGVRGVVSSAAPEAAPIGVQAFHNGGNAFDAALRAALAETVLVPSKCGLAGDLVALCRRAGGPPQALVAIGPAAAALPSAVSGGGELPATGGMSVGVPAAPAGYVELSRWGRLGLPAATEAAITLARGGFAWSLLSYRYALQAEPLLSQQNPGGTVYLPRGRPTAPGALVTLPGLADLMGEFAKRGADLFAGEAGEEVVAAVRSRGGVLTCDDLRQASAEWTTPSVTSVDGRAIWATPAPTHGPSLLRALEGTSLGEGAAGLRRAVLEAERGRKAAAGDAPGDSGTSVVAAADDEGNAVVLVHSNSHPTFGSGIVVPSYDLVLSNRAGRGFSAEPGHPNFPASGRRPVTTLHAWALGDAKEARLFGATSGGENQMVWNAQVLDRLLCGIPPAVAPLMPLWGHGPDGELQAEEGPEAEALRSEVPVETVPAWGLKSGFQVLDVGGPMLSTASDIRCIGGAAGL